MEQEMKPVQAGPPKNERAPDFVAKIMRAAQGGVKWADLDRKDQQVHDECRGEGAEFCKLSSESLGITPQ